MTAALACTDVALVLAGCIACALSFLRRRPRVPGLPGDGKDCLSPDEQLAWHGIEAGWGETASEERSST